ncbi:MAG: glycosyltransferase family A protein [Methanolobus sp.]|uniref:glycosyltransferase family 2 protein n=1 Tax=Methanolobus sp. TaxID=1874737 RepID=UPI0027300DD4|nr:glycosyltransferase family A protein [Methanolobus sp.]MDP2216518.1 glycosyltransferase family A protein [Methanolobus sp.]
MKNYLESSYSSKETEGIFFFGSYENKPQTASIVIVTYSTKKKDLELCLDALTEQKDYDFEIIIVDNNDIADIAPIISNYKLKYIKLKKNFGVNIGRNIGTAQSNGEIIIFLDDDAVPASDFVKQHIIAHRDYEILALRGKSLPKTTNIYNYFAVSYDLGDEIIPWTIDLEGNSSFKKNVLLEVEGFNPNLWGHEGIEISYRILEKYGDKNKLIYSPNPIIYHDYATCFKKYIKKQLRHDTFSNLSTGNSPYLDNFSAEYEMTNTSLQKSNLELYIRLKLLFIRKITILIKRANRKYHICRTYMTSSLNDYTREKQ